MKEGTQYEPLTFPGLEAIEVESYVWDRYYGVMAFKDRVWYRAVSWIRIRGTTVVYVPFLNIDEVGRADTR